MVDVLSMGISLMLQLLSSYHCRTGLERSRKVSFAIQPARP